MVGRNESDNTQLQSLARAEDVLLRTIDRPGPTCLIVSMREDQKDSIILGAALAASYSNAPAGTSLDVGWTHGEATGTCAAEAREKDVFKEMLL